MTLLMILFIIVVEELRSSSEPILAGLDIIEFALNVNEKSCLEQTAVNPQLPANPLSCMLMADRFSCYHLISADAQVNPAPNAPTITSEPSLIRPACTASSSAIGIEAAEVLP
jgi:hypothetical protein